MWLFITSLVITSFICNSPAYAYDNNPLQDICVAVNNSHASVFVNGKICKDPKLATPNDFYFSSLNFSRDVYPKYGIAVTIVGVKEMPGLNTLGISTSRADIEPQSLFPFHMHPRATELITVLEGTLYVGFLVPDPVNFFKSRLFSKILNPGDVFVFPIGLIHFLYNVGHKKAVVFGSYNSQNPGLITIPSSIFASEPPIMDDILAKSFQLNKTEIAQLRNKFS
ncbi:putative germin-like protein 2-1 [Solanum verrucosum]|uniref:putative germin-like protein 2-1 n=1 Tax=Solanum verrucosum TaxID=315347 RepID=UPI0020D15804|nr:putative germin-like protein 2-1 [Solanum verrucosum]